MRLSQRMDVTNAGILGLLEQERQAEKATGKKARLARALAILAIASWIGFLLTSIGPMRRRVRDRFRAARDHGGEPLRDARRRGYGAAYWDSIEKIAAKLPENAEYALADLTPDRASFWVRADLAPRTARYLEIVGEGPWKELIARPGLPRFLVLAGHIGEEVRLVETEAYIKEGRP